MKINEIIEPREVERPVSTPYNVTKMGGKKDRSGGGGGAYAQGTADPRDPHMYRKKLRMPALLKNDAYFQYIKACSPYMKSNPYFPRVYDIVFKKYSNGLIKPSYQMEKLMSIDAAETQLGLTELAYNIAEKIYSDYWFKKRVEQGLFFSDIINDIWRCLLHGTKDVFIDENLIQAIELIRKVEESNQKFTIDLHSHNAMIRLGTTGPQLVITDPLADGGASIAAGYNPFTNKIINPDIKPDNEPL